MSKFYFSKLDDERCYTLKEIREDMRWEELYELEVTEAKRITGEPFFYCTKYKAMSEVGDTCSKLWCADYSPRNGKNGRCRHSGYCYEKTDVKRIIKIK